MKFMEGRPIGHDGSRPERRLPGHFYWVLPDKLAGMAMPGLLGDEADDLRALAQAGVTVLVSLTEAALEPERLAAFGIRGAHFPIGDTGVPAAGPMGHLCHNVELAMARGERVAVHCTMGLTRTGTVLAAILIWIGYDVERAVDTIRRASPRYVRALPHVDFLRRFARELGR